MTKKWWHDKVAYQIYQRAFMIPMETESETFPESSASWIT